MIIRCGPSCWSIAHASCSHGRCSCRPGYSPQVTTKNMNTIAIIIIISINNFTLVLMFIIPITTIFANTSSNRYIYDDHNLKTFQYSALSPPRLSSCVARATNASLQSPHGRGIQVHRYYPGDGGQENALIIVIFHSQTGKL